MIKISFAKTDITPKVPCTLIGYGMNGREATSVLDPIWAKGLTISDVTLFVFDTCFVNNIWQPNEIACATHNHSAPLFNYEMARKVVAEPAIIDNAQIFLAQTTCDVNINRRRWTWKGVKTKPNPYEFKDNILTFVKIIRENHPPIYLINYACHAGMWHGPSVSADWPGRIKIDDAEIMFLQGFSGDLISDNRIGGHFKAQAITEADMDRAGQRVADAVRQAEHRLRPCRGIFRIFNLVP